MCLCFDFSTVLVWDTRPSKSAAPAHAAGQNPAGTLPTFKHLDLTWKPVLRVMYMSWNFVCFQCSNTLLQILPSTGVSLRAGHWAY